MRNASVLLTIGIAALLTAGCAVTLSPEPPAADAASIRVIERDEPVINPYLGLRAFPGSHIVEQSFDGRDSETLFEVSASLQAVYRYLHDQLAADGWRRVSLETESDEIEAEYVRAGLELELELERAGPGLFELELDID